MDLAVLYYLGLFRVNLILLFNPYGGIVANKGIGERSCAEKGGC